MSLNSPFQDVICIERWMPMGRMRTCPCAYWGSRPRQEKPQPPGLTCDRVLNEAQHRARGFIDVEADGIALLWDLDDEVGVPVH